MAESPRERQIRLASYSGVELIAEERLRQVEQEGWTPEHDDTHTQGQLIDAAQSYILAAINPTHPGPGAPMQAPPQNWPWDAAWWKPTGDPLRDLTKAGALIAAEIDRLRRDA